MSEPNAPDPESVRLEEDRVRRKNWKRWGPYLSERQWGTVREDSTLWDVAGDLSRRLTRIFLRDENGRRPVYGGAETFQSDPHWRDHVLFYEYFHGDIGAGLGASHQTGWTGLVAKLLQQSGE